MRPVRVAVVGNLSLDLVDDGRPRVGGPPYYAARALAALGAPALVRAKSAEADRPRLLPPLEALGLPVEWRPGESTAAYAFSYHGDERTMEVRELGSPGLWARRKAVGPMLGKSQSWCAASPSSPHSRVSSAAAAGVHT